MRNCSRCQALDGSRDYRTLDDYLLPQPAFAAMRAEGRLGLAIAPAFRDWHADRRELLTRRMGEVERAAAAGKLTDVVITGRELTISPLRRSVPDEAEALKARLYALTLARLRWTAEWHVRDETYLSALAAIVDVHDAHPLGAVWGPGDIASSDGQSSGLAGAVKREPTTTHATARKRACCSTPTPAGGSRHSAPT